MSHSDGGYLVRLRDSLTDSDEVTLRVDVRVVVYVADEDAGSDGPGELDADATDEALAAADIDRVGVSELEEPASTTIPKERHMHEPTSYFIIEYRQS